MVPGRGVFVRRSGAETLLVALGGLVAQAIEASDLLLREASAAAGSPALARSAGGADVYSLRFAAPFDEEAFLEPASPYARVLVLEEGVARGGFGEYIVSLFAARLPGVAAAAAGFPSKPYPQASREELLARAGLDSDGIAVRVREAEAAESAEGSSP